MNGVFRQDYMDKSSVNEERGIGPNVLSGFAFNIIQYTPDHFFRIPGS